MKLSPEEAEALQKLAGQGDSTPTTFPVKQGETLRRPGSDGGLLLVLNGSGRFLDATKTFGQYTIECLEAPFLVGALQLLKPVEAPGETGAADSCLAAADCEVLDLGDLPLPAELDQTLRALLAQRICSHELPRLARLTAQRTRGDESPDAPGASNLAIPSLESTIADWRPMNSISTAQDQALLMFADRPQGGRQYGDRLEPDALSELVVGTALPRILGLARHPADRRSIRAVPTRWGAGRRQGERGSTSSVQSQVMQELNARDQPRSLTPEPISHGFRWHRPNSRQGAYASVLLSLTEHFDIPIRRETVRRAGEALDRLPRSGIETRILAVADQLGLDGQILTLHRSEDISRLPLPCLWVSPRGVPRLLVAVSGQQLHLLDPASGMATTPLREAAPWLAEQPRLLTLQVGRHTPRNTFGLPWLLPYLNRYRVELAEVFLASFLAQLFALANPLLFQQIIDRVIGQSSDGALMGLTVLMVLFMVLELVFVSLRTFQFAEISNRLDISLGSAIISRLLRLNMRFLQSRPVGELSSRLGELDTIRRFITGTALTVVLDAIFALLYFAVMFVYSATLTGIILGSVPLLMGSIFGLAPVTENLLREKAEAHTRTQALTVELLNGIETIKVQNSEVTAKQRWEERQLETINKGFRTTVANTAGSTGIQLINKATGIFVITVGATLVLNNEMTLGELIAFRIISGYVTQPIIRLAACWQSFQEASLGLERLADVVNQPLETQDDEINNIPMPPLQGRITLEDLSFSYGAAENPQLEGVSLDIPAGSFIGLVGQSGCGKSTLLKLITRLYTPSSGRVLVDGLDIDKVELYSLRRQIGYVPQDCLLFEGTIFANIAVADPDADSHDVVEAARLACAHSFIMNLPNGYSTTIGEKGAGLSGGQRQRIALARMLLQRPRLIILDEATSALDVDTEKQVINNLLETARQSTVLITTHRLSTLQQADQIVVMHNGSVDAQGNHADLMEQRGRYYALYQQQFAA